MKNDKQEKDDSVVIGLRVGKSLARGDWDYCQTIIWNLCTGLYAQAMERLREIRAEGPASLTETPILATARKEDLC